jgi:hypothetical protein
MNDFFDDKKMQHLQNIELEFDEDVEAGLRLLTSAFSLQAAPCPCIESFALYQSFHSPEVVETYQSTSGDFDIAVYQVLYARLTGSGRASRLGWYRCFLALLSLRTQYPRTAIYKESMHERINDWFTRQDVDVKEQKEFSDRF